MPPPPPYYTTTEKVKIKEILNHLGFNLEKENERIIIPQREFKNLISKKFNIIGYRQLQQKFNSILSYLNFNSIKDGVYFYVANDLGIQEIKVQKEAKNKLSPTRKAQIKKHIDDYFSNMQSLTKSKSTTLNDIQAKLSSKSQNEYNFFNLYHVLKKNILSRAKKISTKEEFKSTDSEFVKLEQEISISEEKINELRNVLGEL